MKYPFIAIIITAISLATIYSLQSRESQDDLASLEALENIQGAPIASPIKSEANVTNEFQSESIVAKNNKAENTTALPDKNAQNKTDNIEVTKTDEHTQNNTNKTNIKVTKIDKNAQNNIKKNNNVEVVKTDKNTQNNVEKTNNIEVAKTDKNVQNNVKKTNNVEAVKTDKNIQNNIEKTNNVEVVKTDKNAQNNVEKTNNVEVTKTDKNAQNTNKIEVITKENKDNSQSAEEKMVSGYGSSGYGSSEYGSTFDPLNKQAGDLSTAPVKKTLAKRSTGTSEISETEKKDYEAMSFQFLSSYDISDLLTEEELKKVPDYIQKLDGKVIGIAGYMVPTDMMQTDVSQFLLVNMNDNCCFGGVPKVTEYVFAELENTTAKYTNFPVAVVGTFTLSKDGKDKVLYRMKVQKIIPSRDKIFWDIMRTAPTFPGTSSFGSSFSYGNSNYE